MDADRPANGPILSLFSTPLTLIGCSGDDGPNAQVSVSTYGAGVVPDRPRIITALYKANITHDLVHAKGSFSISVLCDTQRPNIGAGLSGLFQGQPTPLPTAPSAVAPAATAPTISPPRTGDAGLADESSAPLYGIAAACLVFVMVSAYRYARH